MCVRIKLADIQINYEIIKMYDRCNNLVYSNANYKVTKTKFVKSKDKSVFGWIMEK